MARAPCGGVIAWMSAKTLWRHARRSAGVAPARAARLVCKNPATGSFLELSAEDQESSSGHQSSPGGLSLVSVSHSRGAVQACDASRVVMRHGCDGRVVEVAARTRTIPPALRRALHHRDHGCRFPGCGRRFGQGHHIRHWAQGGPTTLSNLALLCRRHHRAVHEEGYQLDRQPDGALRFRRPDGRPMPEVPPPLEVFGDPVKILRAQHDAEGLALNARTTTPGWLGERLDVGWAIDVLHPLAR